MYAFSPSFEATGQIVAIHGIRKLATNPQASICIEIQYGLDRVAPERPQSIEFVNSISVRLPHCVHHHYLDVLREGLGIRVKGRIQGFVPANDFDSLPRVELVAERMQLADAKRDAEMLAQVRENEARNAQRKSVAAVVRDFGLQAELPDPEPATA